MQPKVLKYEGMSKSNSSLNSIALNSYSELMERRIQQNLTTFGRHQIDPSEYKFLNNEENVEVQEIIQYVKK